MPSAVAQREGACCAHAAPGNPASVSSIAMSGVIDAWASCQSASIGTNAATSATGTIANVTTGIATALARGPISETCWNSASDSGTRPSVIAHWARAALAILARPRATVLPRRGARP